MSFSKKLTPKIQASSLAAQTAFLKTLMGEPEEIVKFFQDPQRYCEKSGIDLSPEVMNVINYKLLSDEKLIQHAKNLGPVTDGFLSSITDVVSSAASAVAAAASVVAARAATAATAAANAAEAAAPAVAEAAEAAAPVVAEAAEATAVAAAV